MKVNFLLVIAGSILLSACVGDRLDQRYAPDIPITAHVKANGDICISPSPKENERKDTLYLSGDADEKLIEVESQDLKKGICVTQNDYPFQENHIYSMRLNFAPIDKRRNLQDVSGRAFIAHFKVKKLNGAYEIENIARGSR
ncbi:putative T6SS immunity periplasmic lipoprotein [Serratia marcescens]|uniref:putative T6SS immunity periplasmic lipoprotein n=1 Tax=Serratia marcescens TaxID=615 RepID=UPI002360BBE3|nr:putative T6SS immunity periplasmic lipoprotein [Serratia marcescens]